MKKIIFVAFVIFLSAASSACAYDMTWKDKLGPYGGFISDVIATMEGGTGRSNIKVYSTTIGRGVARSSDGGQNWSLGSDGFNSGQLVFSPVSSKTIAAACLGDRVKISSDEGVSWSTVGSNWTALNYVTSVCFNSITPEIMYAGISGNTGSYGGVWRIDSRKDPATWEQIGFSTYQGVGGIWHDPRTKRLFASPSGVYSTTNEGASWQVFGGASIAGIYPLSSSSSLIYTEYQKVLYSTTNEGRSFQTVPGFSGYHNYVLDPVNRARYAFALSNSGKMVRTLNSGESWSIVTDGLPTVVGYAPASIVPRSAGLPPQFIFAATIGFGNYISVNGGDSWIEANGQGHQPSGSFCDISVGALAVDGEDHLFAGTSGSGAFKSTDFGETWTRVNENMYGAHTIYSLGADTAFDPGVIYAGTDLGVFKSVNGAASWMPASTGLSVLDVFALEVGNDRVYAGTYGAGVFRGVEEGGENGVESWSPLPTLPDAQIYSLALESAESSVLYAGSETGGIFRFTEGSNSWEVLESPGIVRGYQG